MTITFNRPLRATEHCRHYSYEPGLSGGPRCAVGIDLSAPRAWLACMPTPGQPCGKRAEYSADERARWEAWVRERMDRLGKACQALPRAIPERASGHIQCPNCEGSVAYSRWRGGASIKCSTPGCCEAQFNIKAGAVWPDGERT